MMMTKNIWAMLAIASLGTAVVVGCGSTASSDDAGSDDAGSNNDTATTETAGETGGDTGPAPFGLSMGTYCYDVLTIAAGAADGCMLAVDKVVGMALPVNYDPTTGTLTVGTDGSLGAGPISQNKGTLTRGNMPTDPDMPTCSWKQTDTSMVELTATNEFTISVVENESMFAAACTAPPTGGMCTSTWTWTMKINGVKKPADGCK